MSQRQALKFLMQDRNAEHLESKTYYGKVPVIYVATSGLKRKKK